MEDDVRMMKDEERLEKEEEIPIEPCELHCKTCELNVVSCAKEETQRAFVLLVLGCLFVPVLVPIFVLPIGYLVMKDVVHYCPNCEEELEVRHFSPLSFREGFVSIRIGKCMVILKKMYFVLTFLALVGLSFYLNSKILGMAQKPIERRIKNIDYSDLRWETYLKECGPKVMVENAARGNEVFKEKYLGKRIEWKGHIMGVFTVLEKISEYSRGVKIRMIPSESVNYADLVMFCSK